MLGERRVGEGQTVRRKNISSMYFVPCDEKVTGASFTFCVNDAKSAKIRCDIKYTDKVNYAPNLDTDASISVITQSGISVFGELSATDPEGDLLEYIIVRYPTHGTLSMTDSAKGEFKYTPKSNYDGKDEFIFVVRDEYGNYSTAETVSLKVTERMSEVVFADMSDSRAEGAAVAMSAMGIMSGSRLGDDVFFSPDTEVSRAEFVAMAMKAMSVRADTTLTKTYFDDNADIPPSLVSYVATAARCGIVNGAFDGRALNFRPNDTVTKLEAAIIISNLLDISGIDLESDSNVISDSIPIWARNPVSAICSIGIFNTDDDMSAAMTREDVASCLYSLMLKYNF